MGFKGRVKKVLDAAAKEAAKWPAWIRNSDRPRGRRTVVKPKSVLAFLCILPLLTSCVSIAPQDPVAIKNATDVRVEAEILIDKAIDPPGQYAKDIAFLRLRSRQAYEYAKARNDNALSTKQWSIMIDEKRHLLGGFLIMWESKQQGFGRPFLEGVKKNILGGFDEIIRLEKAKQ